MTIEELMEKYFKDITNENPEIKKDIEGIIEAKSIELSEKVINLTSHCEGFEAQINDFVICSLQFDEPLFEKTYNNLIKKWKTSTISDLYKNYTKISNDF